MQISEPISLRWEFLGNNVPRDGLCSAELTLSGIDDLDASGREVLTPAPLHLGPWPAYA